MPRKTVDFGHFIGQVVVDRFCGPYDFPNRSKTHRQSGRVAARESTALHLCQIDGRQVALGIQGQAE